MWQPRKFGKAINKNLDAHVWCWNELRWGKDIKELSWKKYKALSADVCLLPILDPSLLYPCWREQQDRPMVASTPRFGSRLFFPQLLSTSWGLWWNVVWRYVELPHGKALKQKNEKSRQTCANEAGTLLRPWGAIRNMQKCEDMLGHWRYQKMQNLRYMGCKEET